MRIRPFEYYAAKNVEDALEKIEEYGSQAKLIAGGTDLVLAMKKKKTLPSVIISLHRLRELEYVRKTGSQVRIGALTKHTDLAVNPILMKFFPVFCSAVSLIGSWQIRNVATIGGNICTASPSADSAGPLLALDGRAVIVEKGGETEVSLSSFFKGPGETALKSQQLLKEIVLEIPNGRSEGRYLKMMRKRAVDLALVSVTFQAEMENEGNRLSRVAIALGGVAPTPFRASVAESLLVGLSPNDALGRIPDAVRKAMDATKPISDVRASAGYRRAITGVYVMRASKEVLEAMLEEGSHR